MARISNRFFESGTVVRLCAFELAEGAEWAPPFNTEIIHVEPIITEEGISGMYLWALVPSSLVEEMVSDTDDI